MFITLVVIGSALLTILVETLVLLLLPVVQKVRHFLPEIVAKTNEQIIVISFRPQDEPFAALGLLVQQLAVTDRDDVVFFAMEDQHRRFAFGQETIVQELVAWKRKR